MRAFLRTLSFALSGALAICTAQDASQPSNTPAPERLQSAGLVENHQFAYYWRVTSVGDTAQLVTLFCRSCFGEVAGSQDLPLVSVLRDTLGSNDPEDARLTSVWLLSYSPSNFGQKLLSAVPFFYWHIGRGSNSANDVKPLFDLSSPPHAVISGIGRDVLQWTMLDPTTMPIRATSRAYRSNQLDDERLHLEEAATYLREAPVDEHGPGLSSTQIDTVIARLELRKQLLGGFVNERRAADLGEESGFEQERIRSRNWELLRQCAERTGLIFEPISLAGATDQYGLLWFPLGQSTPDSGVSLGPIWKLLNISDPWKDARLKSWKGPLYTRSVDATGSLLPAGASGVQELKLVPLGVYSLTYRKMPLLLIDFRDKLHIRRHEMTQRSINEITAGVIGISHFTNWYYYVAADMYDFVVGRHGAATDQAARLDSYSQFRVALALDQQLDPQLRSQLQRRVNSLSVNPLESAPAYQMQLATSRLAKLEEQARDAGPLLERLDRQRRAELAGYVESNKARIAQSLLHDATFGFYTHRAPKDAENLVALDRDRRIQYNLAFLDKLVAAGTQPEVAFDSKRIGDSLAELNRLLPAITASETRTHAALTLQKLSSLSRDPVLQADCSTTLSALNRNAPAEARPAIGVATSARTATWAPGVLESIK